MTKLQRYPWATNISRRVFMHLVPLFKGEIKGVLVTSHPQEFFHRYIEHKIYSLIIGLGDGPKFQTRIHIETQAKNNYQGKEIYPFSPILLDLNLPVVDNYDSHLFRISSNMGTYNCNYLAYRTQLYLNQKSSSTFHLFLHLPPQSNAQLISQQLLKFFNENNLF